MRTFTLLCFCFLLAPLSASSQSEIDTKLTVVLDSAMAKLHSGNISGALADYAEVRSYKGRIKNDSILAQALSVTAMLYKMQGLEDSVITLRREILTLKHPSDAVLVDTYTNLGGVKRAKLELDSAIFFFKKALVIELESSSLDSVVVAATLIEISSSFLKGYQRDSALTYGLKSLDFLATTAVSPILVNANARMGNVFFSLHNVDRAKDYVNIAIAEAEQGSYKEAHAAALLTRAAIHAFENEFEKSKIALQKATEINEGTYKNLQTEIDIALLNCQIELNGSLTPEEHKTLLDLREITQTSFNLTSIDLVSFKARSMELSPTQFYSEWNALWTNLKADTKLHYAIELQNHKYRFEKRNGLFSDALDSQELLNALQEELLIEKQNYVVYDLEARYKKVQQDTKIKLLDQKNELQASAITSKNQALMAGAIGLLLISLLAIFLFKSRRTIATQNSKISKALNEKDTLLREIHHRVKNNLQVVSSLLRLQSNTTENKGAIGALKESQSRVQSMSLIHQNLYQKENITGIQMSDYLEKLCQNLLDTYSISNDRITLTTDIENLNLDVDSVVPIGLIINELITNSIKYAFPDNRSGSISVTLKEVNNKLRLVVSDTGVGIKSMNEMGETNSFGYRLINSFSRKLEAEVSISAENGTTVEIFISEYQINDI